MNYRFSFLLFAFTFVLSSCNNDDDNSGPVEPIADGILAINEGNFGMGNASLSAVSLDLSEVQNNYFQGINSTPLGDTAQSMGFYEDLAFIVVNVSQKIEVVDRATFQTIETINTGLSNPRYLTFFNDKAYVTNWGDGSDPNDDYVAVINASTFEVESTISVPEGPEEILQTNGILYVAHQGGFGQNNVISVIDAGSNTSLTTITVADVPNSMQLDEMANLWVLCGGKQAWTGDETAGALVKINTATNTISDSFDFATEEHPNFLKLHNGTLVYLLNGGIYEMELDDPILPAEAEITGLNIYNMGVYQEVLYTTDAIDFVSNGTLRSYDMSNNYELINTSELGIIPGELYFE